MAATYREFLVGLLLDGLRPAEARR
jgi:hypothetical protein